MIRVLSHSEPGGHVRNEDAFEIRPLGTDLDGLICAIADGQGGQPGGGEAARLACKVCSDASGRTKPQALLSPSTWPSLLRTADRAVADDPTAGYTTLAAFVTTGEIVCGASCGDSAVALFQGDKSVATLTARQKKDPPAGSGFAEFVTFAAKLVRPWTILAMSDGVWKYVGWERIAKAVAEKHGDSLLEALRNDALLRNGRLQDDFTLIVLTPDDGATAPK